MLSHLLDILFLRANKQRSTFQISPHPTPRSRTPNTVLILVLISCIDIVGMSFDSRLLKEVQPASKSSHSSLNEDVAKEVTSDPSVKTRHERDKQAPAATGGAPAGASAFLPTIC